MTWYRMLNSNITEMIMYWPFNFSLKIESKLGIDVEDYHPGETNDRIISNRVLRLMEKTLKKTNYVSFAAPLIQKEVAEYMMDKHVSKILLEAVQMLCSAKRILNPDDSFIWWSVAVKFSNRDSNSWALGKCQEKGTEAPAAAQV